MLIHPGTPAQREHFDSRHAKLRAAIFYCTGGVGTVVADVKLDRMSQVFEAHLQARKTGGEVLPEMQMLPSEFGALATMDRGGMLLMQTVVGHRAPAYPAEEEHARVSAYLLFSPVEGTKQDREQMPIRIRRVLHRRG